MNLSKAIQHLASQSYASLNDDGFNRDLAIIQELIGQPDGDLSGVVFSDLDDNAWEVLSYNEKITFLTEYIQREFDYLYNFDVDSEEEIED